LFGGVYRAMCRSSDFLDGAAESPGLLAEAVKAAVLTKFLANIECNGSLLECRVECARRRLKIGSAIDKMGLRLDDISRQRHVFGFTALQCQCALGQSLGLEAALLAIQRIDMDALDLDSSESDDCKDEGSHSELLAHAVVQRALAERLLVCLRHSKGIATQSQKSSFGCFPSCSFDCVAGVVGALFQRHLSVHV